MAEPKGTFIEKDIIKSKAYLNLGGIAPQLLTMVLYKRRMSEIKVGKGRKKQWICTNGDSLNITYPEMRRYGITQPRLTRAIDQLLEKGFISLIHQGGGIKGDKSTYALSDKYRLWQPGICFETRPREYVQRGFRGKHKKK